MRREGSPWRGVGVVFFRELFDHLTSVRMLVLEFLVFRHLYDRDHLSIATAIELERVFGGWVPPNPAWEPRVRV